MSSLRKKFPSCFVRVKAKNMPTVICGYSLIPWDILDQVEVFFHYLDRHVTDDIGFSNYETDIVSDRAVELPAGILDFLDDLLLVADAQAHRFEGSTAYYA
jgi:hypothetical protein